MPAIFYNVRNFIRLSNSHFWYYAVLGLAVPFLAVFLEGRGFNSLQMGEILAVFMATRIVGPTFWAMLADKTGKQLPYIRLGATLALLSFIASFFVDGYWPITITLACFSIFWTGMQPQLEVLTLMSIRRSAKFYARIRLWGSIGFIVITMISAEVIGIFGSESFIALGFFILLGLWLSTFWLNDIKASQATTKSPDDSGIVSRLIAPSFLLFFIAGLLLQLSFGPYYSFFALYLRDLAYPSYAVGVLLSVAVIAEIGIFIIAGRLFKNFRIKVLIVFSLLVTALRWYLMAYFGDVAWLLVLTQITHAASFGLYHSASMQYIQRHFTPAQQNRAQAVYVSGVYGIGGAIGAYLAGLLWLDGAGAEQSFIFAASAALIAAIIGLFINIKHIDPKKHRD